MSASDRSRRELIEDGIVNPTPQRWQKLARQTLLTRGRGQGFDVQWDEPDGLGEFVCERVTEADANMMIRCVNSHDALVAACKAFVAARLNEELHAAVKLAEAALLAAERTGE